MAHNDPNVSLPSSAPVAVEVDASIATVLVGRNTLLRECLAHFLATSNYRVAASELAFASIDPGALPVNQVVLLIVDAGSEIDAATQQIARFRGQCPSGRVVVLTDVDHRGVPALFNAGAHAVCRNDSTADAFVRILDKVMQDGPRDAKSAAQSRHMTGFNGTSHKQLLRRSPQLFDQDLTILRCLAQGHSNNDIAMQTGIALATAKLRVKAILRKIGARNRTQAAVWALRQDMFH